MAEQAGPHDPFAIQLPKLCPAISRDHKSNTTIDVRLFEGVFQTPEFTSWATGTKPWQLHCFGGPGCGKTELAAVTAQRLRKIQGNTIPVLTVFITEDVLSPSLIFIEDFLRCINDQLRPRSPLTSSKYECTSVAGQPIKDRILALECDIGNRLISACISSTCAFLIVDGYDRINEGLQTIIERSLTELHQRGLRTFMTRRVPVMAVPVNAVCDSCRAQNLSLYWVCSECQKKDMASWFWLCYPCRDSGQACTNCTQENFLENRLSVNLPLSIDGPSLIQYLSDELEREFGPVEPEMCEKITRYVSRNAGGNIALVRLYLENILTEETLFGFDPGRVADRLPSNVIAFFDTELGDVKALSEEQRKIALLSIAIAATNDYGVPLADFERRLRPHVAPLRSVEEVLCTAKGWLTQQNTKDREIGPFSPIFALYATDDYDEALTHARITLEASKLEVEQAEENAMVNFASDSSVATIGTPPSISTSIDTLSTRQISFRSIGRSLSQDADHGMIQITGEDNCKSPSRMDTGEISDLPDLLDTPMTKFQPEPPIRQVTSEAAPRICSFCHDNILGSGATFGEHRSSLKGTKTAKNCIFCEALYDKLSKPEKIDYRWPMYKWTIRSSSQGRAGKRSIVLTFRSAQGGVHYLPSKRFYLFAEDDIHTATSSSLGESTNPLTNPHTTGEQIRKWVQTCNQHHLDCHKPSKTSFVPTRLLDLQSSDPNIFRIINTRYTPAAGPYCTLSHSWGTSEFIQTTASNLEQHLLEGVHLSCLPKNFCEAIEVVRMLGIRYIWIDSLCIIQGPSGDFDVQGGLMHAVYRNSYCNIVAADSDGAEGGLFRTRTLNSILAVSHTVRQPNMMFGEAGKRWKILPGDLWDSNLLQQNIIYTRGWVFQERLLSPRLLHFAHNQIFWDCASTSACETLPSGFPTPLDTTSATDRHWRGRLALTSSPNTLSGPIDNESPYTFWNAAVRNYTFCNLTNNSDKCLAIWSVAKILRDILHEEYAAGMWAKQLVEQLAWKVQDSRTSKRSADLQVENPSWTWTSIHGGIVPQHRIAERVYRITDHEGNELGFKLKDGKGGRDQMPILTSKSLAISGYVHSAYMKKNGRSESGYELSVRIDKSREVVLDAFPDEDPGVMPELYADCDFLVLALSTTLSDEEVEEELDGAVYEYGDETGENVDVKHEDDEDGSEGKIETKNGDDETETETFDSSFEPISSPDLEFYPASNPFSEKYYGIGLLLITYARWLELQQRRLPSLQHEHDLLQQQADHSSCYKRACNLKKELEGVQKLLGAERKSGKEGELRYRRVGMVKFREMDREIWRFMQRGMPLNFWLD